MLAAIAKFFGVPNFVVIGGLIVLALGGGLLGKCAYDRSVIEMHVTKQQNKQLKRERKADTNLNTQKDKDDSSAEQRKKEMDDATKGIPDRSLSPRQRRIACVELMRQGNAPPECHPAG